MKCVKTVAALRTNIQVLLCLLAGVLMQSVLFFFDVNCSGWPVWISFAAMAVLLSLVSPRRFFGFLLLTLVLTALTAFTFSYAGCPDVMSYHFPMQDLIRNGWNPVCNATTEAVGPLFEGRNLGLVHTLFLPRFVALAGALAGAATRLYAGEAFLGYALLISLFFSALSFARRIMSAGRFVGVLFAFSMTFTTMTRFVLIGLVDYEVYAAMMLMMFSGLLYAKDGRYEDLVALVLGVVIVTLTKTTGLVVATMFCLLLLCLRRDRNVFIAYGVAAALVLLIGFSPMMTSWINYSCPFYPTMSWSATSPAIDITSDFSGNDDALRMGYVARAAYAWVSPRIVTAVCSWWYGKPGFDPVFTVSGGVAGFGSRFCLQLGLSALALAFSKKNSVTLLCGFILATAFVMPLKYIGFSRYVPQMWAIPVLSLFNLFVNPAGPCHGEEWSRLVRSGFLLIFPVQSAFGCFLATSAAWCRGLAVERARQEVLSDMKGLSKVWQVNPRGWNTYSLTRRMEAAGLEWEFHDGVADRSGPVVPDISLASCQGMWPAMDLRRADELDAQLVAGETTGERLRFCCRQVQGPFPRPVWAVRHRGKAGDGLGKGR